MTRPQLPPRVTWDQLDHLCKLLQTTPTSDFDSILKIVDRRMEDVETLWLLRRDGAVTVTRTATATTTFDSKKETG